MKYISVSETAKLWEVSDRSVRNYCTNGRVVGAVLEGKTWKVPRNAKKPCRKQRAGKIPEELLPRLKYEKDASISGGIYHRLQIEFAYNSNHIEGSRLSHDQTRYIYETNTIGFENAAINVDDIMETVNHFRCLDLCIDMANYPLSEAFIKQLHLVLMSGTTSSRKAWFAVGEYKRIENEVAGNTTAMPKDVSLEMKKLITGYNKEKKKTFEDIAEFHYNFEKIHPFQDGNGRVGRLVMFKECLRNGITPFIITDDYKEYYYRGLKQWKKEPGYLLETLRSAQDEFLGTMKTFGIK